MLFTLHAVLKPHLTCSELNKRGKKGFPKLPAETRFGTQVLTLREATSAMQAFKAAALSLEEDFDNLDISPRAASNVQVRFLHRYLTVAFAKAGDDPSGTRQILTQMSCNSDSCKSLDTLCRNSFRWCPMGSVLQV